MTHGHDYQEAPLITEDELAHMIGVPVMVPPVRGLPGCPDWAGDRVTTEVDIHLDWRDRVRALLSGRIDVTTHTWVMRGPVRTEPAETVVRVLWPRWLTGLRWLVGLQRPPVMFEACTQARPPALAFPCVCWTWADRSAPERGEIHAPTCPYGPRPSDV